MPEPTHRIKRSDVLVGALTFAIAWAAISEELYVLIALGFFLVATTTSEGRDA